MRLRVVINKVNLLVRDIKKIKHLQKALYFKHIKKNPTYNTRIQSSLTLTSPLVKLPSGDMIWVLAQMVINREEFDLTCEYMIHSYIPAHSSMKNSRSHLCPVTVKSKPQESSGSHDSHTFLEEHFLRKKLRAILPLGILQLLWTTVTTLCGGEKRLLLSSCYIPCALSTITINLQACATRQILFCRWGKRSSSNLNNLQR